MNECAKQFMPPTHTKAMLEAAAKKILEANHQKADAASVKKLMSAHASEVTEAALKGADAKKAAARKRLHAKAAAAHKKVQTLCPFRPNKILTPFSVSTCRINARGHTPCPAARCQHEIVGASALTDLTSRPLRSAGLSARTALFPPRENALGGAVHPSAAGCSAAGLRRSEVMQRSEGVAPRCPNWALEHNRERSGGEKQEECGEFRWRSYACRRERQDFVGPPPHVGTLMKHSNSKS